MVNEVQNPTSQEARKKAWLDVFDKRGQKREVSMLASLVNNTKNFTCVDPVVTEEIARPLLTAMR
jgi:hypothetical protein